MRKNIILITLPIVFLLCVELKAQVNLPYYSGFDNANQQNGWVEFKTASTQYSHWLYGSQDAYSAPNCLSHSYSPSTGIKLTDNWFVSPGFAIPNGGKLDSIRYSFSGFSQPEIGDTIAIYLLNGSGNPSAATNKTLLFDFRGSEYIIDNTYRMKSNIILPQSEGLSYFAIRYRNTDCSSKWLTVCFDNVAISGNTVGINELSNHNNLLIYPNPTKGGKFYMNYSVKPLSIKVFNQIGQMVQNVHIIENVFNKVEIDLSNQIKGIYVIEVREAEKRYTQKIVYE